VKTVQYVGPFDAVEVLGQVVEQGATAEFTDEEAKSLLEQEPNWRPVKAAKKSEG
jgi:hypothetical protein